MQTATPVAALLLTLSLNACQQAEPGDVRTGAAAEDVAPGDSAAEHSDQAATEDDSLPPPPTRQSETARDAGEKPREVMAELGISEGGHVADVMAGGGYYTYLLSDAVGSDGVVYATGAQMVSRRLEEGDLAGRTNIQVIESLEEVPSGSLDAVLINRAYHLISDPGKTFFPALRHALKPGGRIGVIEVRLNAQTGHDMRTHRMGQETVREEIESGGFRLVEASEILANPEDPGTDFLEGRRHLADRMFLVFEKPAETALAPRR
ncbi:MAG: hypothetical protein ABR599_09485 [Gemmatimonadota bacterium]